MINWLHTFQPQAILISLGPVNIYWYGLFIVVGISAALLVSLKIARHHHIQSDKVFDISFWLIINGLIGARIYEVFLELPYYLSNPLNMIRVWEGGLAIHGAIIAGLLTLLYFAKKEKISFWNLASLFAPGLALGQAIGRWGNYFNQELFGQPTSLPWGIPINPTNRPSAYQEFAFFHPTFLYESLGLILIFLILFSLTTILLKEKSKTYRESVFITCFYLILSALLRFSLEYIKIDNTPVFLGLRWPQFFSLIIILFSIISLIFSIHAKKNK